MTMTWRKENFPDVFNLVVGAALLISPWLFGFMGETAAAWNAALAGAFIAILALAAIAAFDDWEEWLTLAAGAWVAISPWLLGFTGNIMATRVHAIAGIIVAVVAAVRLWMTHNGFPRVTASG
jgi:hypothetical protein